jgi:hypothetical protein
MRKGVQLPSVQHSYIPLQGGFDLLTPTLRLKPGVLRDTLNFEAAPTGGYRRIDGYERYDGRPNPSDAGWSTITVTAIGTLAVGDTVNGQTSGATGYIIAIDGLVIVMTKTTGAFAVAENAREGVAVQGVVTALGGAVTDARTSALYTNLAADAYRTDILAVPGSGPIRGVAYYNSLVYAWRNNAGGTALDLYKSSAAGWVNVPLGEEISFSNANTSVQEGDTLTQGAVTSTIMRVMVQTGTLASGVNTGRLIISGRGGGNYGAGAATSTGGGALTLAAIQTAITLLPDGRVVTETGSFTANTSQRLYFADGVNRGAEFDGTTWAPISTGMTVDAPDRVTVHQRHLFFSYGSSIQHSGIGTPYMWTVVVGAGELSVDGDVTDWVRRPGAQSTGSLVIYCRNSTHVLYGTDSITWNLTTYSPETGGIAYTAQAVGSSYILDDRGVVELAAVQEYGNFSDSAITTNIRPWLQTRRNRATGSSVNREKNQYRLFFSDGSGLYVTINKGRLLGAMPVAFDNPVTVACNGETPDGAETNFFGSTNGFVYRLDAGTSLDGGSITATALLNFDAQGDSRVRKRYRRGSLEIQGASYVELQIGYNLSYGDSTIVDQGAASTYSNTFSAPYWNTFVWDSFVWDGLTLSPNDIEITGQAENIAIRIDCNGDYFDSFTLNSLILSFTTGRGLR